jgi:hypothetical protein
MLTTGESGPRELDAKCRAKAVSIEPKPFDMKKVSDRTLS